MSLKCGIVGLPNVGKSTLFNALSSAKAQAANFPFCTIEPNIGVITIPDERLLRLEELVHPEKIVPTTIEFVDIAGLVEGASKGEGLGNQFLSHIRKTDAVIHVIRCFDDNNITHINGSINPVKDKEIIDTELQLKDMDTLEKSIKKNEKNTKSGDKAAIKTIEVLNLYQKHLASGQSARTLMLAEEDKKHIDSLCLLSNKPILYVCNVDEASVINGNTYVKQIKENIEKENAECIIVSAAIEAEIAQLDNYEDRKEFLTELKLKKSGIEKLIQAAYKLLNLITYFTAGEKEVKAWTVQQGSNAPQAAGIIHTDFEKGFIKAEVITYKNFIELGSEQACKNRGKLHIEGKDYIVKDGDILHFRFNV